MSDYDDRAYVFPDDPPFNPALRTAAESALAQLIADAIFRESDCTLPDRETLLYATDMAPTAVEFMCNPVSATDVLKDADKAITGKSNKRLLQMLLDDNAATQFDAWLKSAFPRYAAQNNA